MKKIILSIVCIFLTYGAWAQGGYDWGKSKKLAEPKYLNVSINYNTDDYKKTIPRIQWLVKNAPNVHKNLYIWGASVYKRAEKEETDPLKKINYQDSTLFMYDEQMNRFGAHKEASNFKGLVAYKYLSKRENSSDSLYALYKKIIDLNGNESFKSNVYYYMLLSLVKFSSNQITEDNLLGAYQNVNQIYSNQRASAVEAGKKTDNIDKYSSNVEKIFSKYYTLTCSSIEKIYTNNLNSGNALEVKNLLEAQKCTSSLLYEKSIMMLVESNPSEENKLALADYNMSNGKKAEAIKTYKELLKSSDNKGLLNYKLMLAYKSSNRSLAVAYAKSAIDYNYKKVEVATYIGDLFFNSLDECRTEDVVKTRALYLAAYKYYRIAGNTSQMATAKAQFPSQEEVFLGEYKVGQSISTGCWINEKVIIQVR